MKTCPACSKSVQTETADCPFCGVIFEKWKPRTIPPIREASAPPLLSAPQSKKRSPYPIYAVLMALVGFSAWSSRNYIDGLWTRVSLLVQGMYTEQEFFSAIHRGDLEAVNVYLKARMPLNTPWQGMTALHVAVNNERSGIVQALLAAGADPNIKDGREGRTPLGSLPNL